MGGPNFRLFPCVCRILFTPSVYFDILRTTIEKELYVRCIVETLLLLPSSLRHSLFEGNVVVVRPQLHECRA